MVSTQVNIPGYQVSDELYNGSRTLVYRAVRESDAEPVVIKLLKNPYPTFSELVQFRNQYTIAKNLNFAGIIQTYSLEPYENGYALLMEDFGGISLKDFARLKTLYLVSGEEFLHLAISLCDTLDFLIRHRIIHKDIKPANILINPETKQVKLIDFSIASLLPRETQTLISPNVLEGTLAYISPEQTGRMNRGIDYRTDFYSLGVSFYELLTGELPFSSNDAMELVHCHIAKTAPLVNQINPQIPTVLSEIVRKLMAKNAEERYQSALGLKYDLEKCYLQLKQTGSIESFAIAQRDVSDRFIIPDKLYGREAEVSTLLQAFERVSQSATEMMLVAGFSGIGKTAVVNEVHKPIVRQRGYFIKGKFDQFNRNIPFSAFVQAFRDLMGQLLTESDAQIPDWKSKILAAIGESGQIIIEVIPELERIIGEQPPVVELSGTSAQNRFNLCFQKFIQVFTTPEHPLVMFLDDLQWADSASLKLIQLLMNDTKHLFLIGAYRDNEVNAAHPLILTLNEIQKTAAIINTITLAPLNLEQVNQLVADTLKCTEYLALPLSRLIVQKTQGNPFFATQFLKALYEDEFIQFHYPSLSPLSHGGSEGGWECDITQVIQQALTDDVVEFMALQLRKMPHDSQEIIKLAACIGNQFDLETLAIVAEKSEIETASCLWNALQSGLILPQNEVYKFFVGEENQVVNQKQFEVVKYKFLHDRVQQAAYSLIPDNQKQTTHYHIGQLLLQRISPEAREERIFELVNQLNYGTALITQQSERDELAQLNLIACYKARSATAYQAGRLYASTGLSMLGVSMLGENAWQRQYKISLELHELAAEFASLCGDFEAMEQLIELVITQAHSLLEKLNVYRIRIIVNVFQNKLLEAIAIAQQLLQNLGVTFPQTLIEHDIQSSIAEVRQLIRDREIEKFVHLPMMTDKEKIAIVQMAVSIMPAAFRSGSLLFPFLVALAVKLSIQYGNTSASAHSYVCYGIISCNLLKDVDTGVKFGRLAVDVIPQLNAKLVKPEALVPAGIFILHRKYHVKETLPLLQEGYTSSLEVGSYEYAGYSAFHFCLHAFCWGQTLESLEPETRAYCNGLVQVNQLSTANYCRIYWQSILNLLGGTEHPINFSGTAIQESEFLPLLIANNDLFGLYFFHLCKLMLSYMFGEIPSAKHHAVEVRRCSIVSVGMFGEPVFYFYDSLTNLALFNPQSEQRSEILDNVSQNQIQLQQHWANHAPMNHQHKVDLVEAEKYRVLGQKTEAIELYDRAISGAKANGYIQEEALANELAAKFYLDWGKQKVAITYMQEAYYCYARWGAKAKTDELEKRYPQLLQPILQQQQLNLNPIETISRYTVSQTCTFSASISDILDFTSVLKAAQTISSSIELNQLITNLTRIILETSGAKKSVLILPQENTWQVRAITWINQESNFHNDVQTILDSQSIDNCQHIPRKIINHVKNYQERVIINDGKTDIPGLIGQYMLEYQPQSVLCTPIINQANLVGILYLENQLTSGVFTSERLQVINLLSSQAAISLENARLYQQAQQALQDLQKAQLQIVQSEKMSALGNLVAGVAHEMNNPLGFISASLQQVKPTLGDIIEHLKLYQQNLINPSDQIINHAEKIDLDYSLKDLPKIIESMMIASDRLKNISTSLRTFSRADQDYKVRFNIHEGIDSTILILKHRLKANQTRPTIEVSTNYGKLPMVECFPGQLNQVFMNILANAIDALEESNAGRSFAEIEAKPNRITITTSIVDKNVKITICDNGKGMNEAVKQKIFEHLFTTKPVGKGTGLGLAISKQIVVDKHQGMIDVNSTLGKGSEFIIYLPIRGN